ncbi:MAG: hypothetical protein JSR82_06515 [Verrucomicrobia bacterium]|nr:hypothetical protein [Verrucomicrobiota bacterium]
MTYPIFWLTLLLFGLVAGATRDLFVGSTILALAFPLVVTGQGLLRWVCRQTGVSTTPRRIVMLIPALVVSGIIFHGTNDFGGRQIAALRFALAGATPEAVRDLRVVEGWPGYLLLIHFRCDPGSLQRILEKPPFQRDSAPLALAPTPFADLPTITASLTFERTDMVRGKGFSRVYTDAAFSFAYVVYVVD